MFAWIPAVILLATDTATQNTVGTVAVCILAIVNPVLGGAALSW
jgi:hypothetical protein